MSESTDQPDYRLIALEKASLLPNTTAAELLHEADKIYNWLIQDKIVKQESPRN